MAACAKCGKRLLRRPDGLRKCKRCGFAAGRRNLCRSGLPKHMLTIEEKLKLLRANDVKAGVHLDYKDGEYIYIDLIALIEEMAGKIVK